MPKTATPGQSEEHYICQTVLNVKTVISLMSFTTGASCSVLAIWEMWQTAMNDVGIKCSNIPNTQKRHVPSSSIMTPRLPLLQLHLSSYNSLPSVSHWTRSATNRFLWLRIDIGKSEVISRLKCSVCNDLES